MDAIRRYRAAASDWWHARSVTMRWSTVGGATGVLLGLAIAFSVVATGGGGSGGGGSDDGDQRPDVVLATPTPTQTPTPSATPETATPVASPSGGRDEPDPSEFGSPTLVLVVPDEEPELPMIGSLRELHETYGEAPDSTLGRFRIPVLGVDAPLGQRFVSGSTMPNPTGPGDVVWYDLSQWEGLGGVPGGGNNAIFSGHVDYFAPVAWAEAIYGGRGVFFDLNVLSPGDIIEIEVGGSTFQYAVVWRQQVSSGAEGNWASILDGHVAVDSITLITCGGDFDLSQRSYHDRVVIRAERV